MPPVVFTDWMWAVGGPFITVCIGLWLFYTNRIYTRKAVEDIIEGKNKDIADSDKRAEEYWQLVKTNLILAEKALDSKAEREARR